MDCCEGSSCQMMQLPAYQGPPLEERELTVLRELAWEYEARVAFQGLRRRTGLHQQILTRTLRRLVEAGLVAHDARGYALTEQGWSALVGQRFWEARPEVLTLMQALLPPDVPVEAIAERLARRWFKGLHWYGESHAPGESALLWLTETDGAVVTVRLAGGMLTLEAELPEGAEERRSFGAARALLAELAEVYGMPAAGPSPAPSPAHPATAPEEANHHLQHGDHGIPREKASSGNA